MVAAPLWATGNVMFSIRHSYFNWDELTHLKPVQSVVKALMMMTVKTLTFWQRASLRESDAVHCLAMNGKVVRTCTCIVQSAPKIMFDSCSPNKCILQSWINSIVPLSLQRTMILVILFSGFCILSVLHQISIEFLQLILINILIHHSKSCGWTYLR